MPTKFNNSNVVFRCPSNLKDRMKAVAEKSGLHLSAFVRSACVERLRSDAKPQMQAMRELDQ